MIVNESGFTWVAGFLSVEGINYGGANVRPGGHLVDFPVSETACGQQGRE